MGGLHQGNPCRDDHTKFHLWSWNCRQRYRRKVVGYDVITGRDVILDSDYIQNITWVGCLLGEDKPCIIQVFNGFNENGLTLAIADKDNGKVEAQFYGNLSPEVYDSEDEIKPPFKIFRPTEKTEATETSEA